VLIYAQLTCVTLDPAPAVVCPPVRAWSKSFQTQVEAEMRAAPNRALEKVAVQAIGDRDIARACASTKKGAR
jgi:hypothetical protein